MYGIVDALPQSVDPATCAVVRVVEAQGLGARWPGQVAVVTPSGEVVGDVLGGALDAQLALAVPPLLVAWVNRSESAVLRYELSHDDAEGAGLPCGGAVSLLVQSFADIPVSTLVDVAARRPTAILTQLDSDPVVTAAFTADASAVGSDDPAAELAELLIARAEPADSLVDTPEGRVLVSVFVPQPHLVVIGSGGLARALAAQTALLGWSLSEETTADGGVSAVRALGPGDGVLVIDHRGEVDFPILSEALLRGVGYVAALGSRRTQEGRTTRLREGGIGDELIGRVRGPAGLDIGSRSPAEIAVAIVAEMLSVRGSSAGGALRDGAGSINGPRD